MHILMVVFELLKKRMQIYQKTNPLEYDMINAMSWKTNTNTEEILGYNLDNFNIRIHLNYSNVSINIVRNPDVSDSSSNIYHICKPIQIAGTHKVIFAKFQHTFKENSEIIQSIKDVFDLDFIDLNEKSYFEMSCLKN